MTSSTLTTTIAAPTAHPAVIIPPLDLTLTYSHLHDLITRFQHSLAAIGISHNDAVSISLPNTLEFIVIFLAVGAQRAIAAPLNPNYKQEEFEFYIDDLKSRLVIVPRGDVGKDSPAVRAARRFGVGVAEVWWDGQGVGMEVKEKGKGLGRAVEVQQAKEGDVALVLHTSGTTGRPKAVCAIFYFILNSTQSLSLWVVWWLTAVFYGSIGATDSQELNDDHVYVPALQ